MNHEIGNKYSNLQLGVLVLLRVLIGWHFLYEGLVKLTASSWTASGYLNSAKGFLAPFFKSLASDPGIISIIDLLNIIGLIAVGVGLILGLLTRWATLIGIILLAFYYLAQPPLMGYAYTAVEGNYLLVNKVLIELVALAVLYFFPSGKRIGLDRLLRKI